ncbi:MAG: ATP-dependent DNA helicase RecG [Patescibacteria group bacterium]|nr:ATP-dependent DNA helicase RecG [Patescibacteria group bacterium]
MNEINLNTPLIQISGIAPRFIAKLKKMNIETVKDLLWHFPTRYEDFSKIYKIAELIPNQEATIQGTVEKIKSRRTWHRNLFLMEAEISDDTGSIRAIWFNQPYIKNVLQPGRLANFSGKITVSRKDGDIYLSNPTYELVNTHKIYHETKHTARIVPIYPETRGLTSKGLRYLIKPILNGLTEIQEIIPYEILEKEKLLEINIAIRKIHFPNTIEEALIAKRRFAFEDLFFLQLINVRERLKLAKEKSMPIKNELEKTKKLIKALPFELTLSQKKSLWEILQDLEKPRPMNRLLQGDVGSGKTVVAAIAALITAQNGCQAVFMAPTEILAQQHYRTFKKIFPEFGDGLALLTSNESKTRYGHELEANTKKTCLYRGVSQGKIKIIIGTHALIQKNLIFNNLTLVVVDEQHRFGVKQRAELVKNKEFTPHLLSMSATPIPRTLSLTIFGDLDLSLIDELPKNRKQIITKVVDPKNRNKAYAFIREQIKKGRQAFVICPRIEPSEKKEESIQNNFGLWVNIKAVKEEYEKLSKKIFPDFKVAMLHGKMPTRNKLAFDGKPTKEKIMRDFAEGKIDIIVATSIVEVGVDVPNATIMMIEGADRFGLAQLYQFRGRIGRGEHQSFCFLFTESTSKTTHQRLKSIVEAKNGFELAEKDLRLRGPGEFLGEAQTGMPDIAMKAIQNPDLVKSAREAAINILTNDPLLKNHPDLHNYLNQFQKQVHWE